MARLIADGEVKMQWAPTVADMTAPTAAEITAGDEITSFISSLETPLEGSAPDASDVSSAFNKTVAGTYGGSVSAEMYRDDTDDDAFAMFPRNTTGYLIIRRFGGSDVDFAAADEVEVWHLRVITRSPSNIDRETVQSFNVQFATLSEPEVEATVAA